MFGSSFVVEIGAERVKLSVVVVAARLLRLEKSKFFVWGPTRLEPSHCNRRAAGSGFGRLKSQRKATQEPESEPQSHRDGDGDGDGWKERKTNSMYTNEPSPTPQQTNKQTHSLKRHAICEQEVELQNKLSNAIQYKMDTKWAAACKSD